MAARLRGRTLVEYQFQVSACFCYIYICGISCGIWSTKLLQKRIYIWGISCCISNSINFTETHIYIWGISCGISKLHMVFWRKPNILFFEITYIYMRNIVWHIQVLQKAETFIILEGSGCQKLKHSPFCRVPCLPKAYRNQANTPSLGIALWNICGISKVFFWGLSKPWGQLSEGMRLPFWRLVRVATSICFWAQRVWHSSCLKACGCHFGGWFV